MSIKEVKPLKVQDEAYLRTMRNIERKKIERLQAVVPGALAKKGGKIMFAENEHEGTLERLEVTDFSPSVTDTTEGRSQVWWRY
jgi:hypothetical protein